MNPLTLKAVRDVSRRRLRSALTTLGIALGVMGLTAISLASSQMSTALDFLNSTTQPDITFSTAPATAPVKDDLSRQPNVKSVAVETLVVSRWAVPTGHMPLFITGIGDTDNVSFNPFELTEGQLPGPGEILMEQSARSVEPIHVGDTVQVQAGRGNIDFRVSGITSTPGTPSPTFAFRALGYMRTSELQSQFEVRGSNLIQVRLQDYERRVTSARALASVLHSDGLTIVSSQVGRDLSGGTSGILTGIFTVMQVLSLIALLLTLFLLLSTVTALVAEQVPVIGTMKAVGARTGQVLRSYLTGVAIYGVLGTVVGLALGILLGDLLYRFFAVNLGADPNALNINASLVVVAAVVGIGVPVAAAALPVYLGTRVTVKQALSGYGLSGAGRRGRLWGRVMARIFNFLPKTSQVGLRSLFRRRTRALLTIAALAISGAAFLAVQTTTSSWNAVISSVFASYRADVFASFSNPQPYSSVQDVVTGVPGVAAVEPWSETGIKTSFGDSMLVGLQPDSMLYHKQLMSGRWFTDRDTDAIVISLPAAQKSGLKVGDSIDFHTDLHHAHWRVVGIAKDYFNPLGAGVLLVPLTQANTFNGLPADYAQALMITSMSSKQSDIDAMAKRVDDALGATQAQAQLITSQADIQISQSVFLVLYALFYSVVVIIALVGAIGLFNALAMGVLERRREIGILRSMGATGRQVAQVFWTEGVGQGVVAWVIAVAIGIPAAYGFVQLLGAVLLKAPFTFNPLSMVAMLVFIVVVATLATLGPVWSASRIRIAQTLRYA